MSAAVQTGASLQDKSPTQGEVPTVNDEQLDAIQAVVHQAGALEVRANEMYSKLLEWQDQARELLLLGSALVATIQNVEDDDTGRIEAMRLLSARAAFDAGVLSMLLSRSQEDLLGFLAEWDMESDKECPAVYSLGRCALLAKHASLAALEAAGLND